MKKTFTVILAALIMLGFASCLDLSRRSHESTDRDTFAPEYIAE